jgi:hypothetical protein
MKRCMHSMYIPVCNSRLLYVCYMYVRCVAATVPVAFPNAPNDLINAPDIFRLPSNSGLKSIFWPFMIRQTTSKYLAVWRIKNGQNIDFRPELLGKRKMSGALIKSSGAF